MSSPSLLTTSIAEKPFPVSSIKFHIGMAETSPTLTAKHAKMKMAAPQNPLPQPDSLTVDPFSIQLGPSTSLEVQGNMDGVSYRIAAKGLVPLERLLTLGKATGFPSTLNNFNASAMVDLNINGAWANFEPAALRGTAHMQNLAAWVPGLKNRLIIAETDAQLTDTALVLNHLNGR